MTFVSRSAFSALLIAAAIAGCGRAREAPSAPKTYEEAMIAASRQWELNRWTEVFAACDRAFSFADRDREPRVVRAVECAAEAAARKGTPELALPHYERLVAAHAEALRTANGRHRLANNHGVLLIEKGRRAEGIARLEWALRDFSLADYATSGYRSFSVRATIVKNLARAYYDRASEPAIRAWVQEQGTLLSEHMDPKVRGAQFAMGASSALASLVVIGLRQANTDTPAWEARIREWEPLEEEIAAVQPSLARACEDVPLRTTMMETCLREVALP